MDIWQSALLGIIEGITEFLPISSTGHLILANEIFGIPQTDFTKSFEIIIQLGAILSVVFLYWKTLWNLEIMKKLAAAFIPTGIIGFLAYKIVKTYLLGNETVVLWSLFFGGLALIIFEYRHKENGSSIQNIGEISYRQAVMIGFCQSLAIIPGVSRSAATILGGLSLGLKRSVIVEFSFLLAVPTMLAASGLDLVKNYSTLFSPENFWLLAVGFIVSFVVALGSVKFLLRHIQKHNFIPFGVYRIAAALLFWIIFFG
jgi:undecaprenyl-diphosphatase